MPPFQKGRVAFALFLHLCMTDTFLLLWKVCATDGVTYPDEATMRTVGGNVRIDYMGRCDDPDSIDDDTPRQRCMQVRENGRCPSLQGCAMRVLPSDACCPVCGK